MRVINDNQVIEDSWTRLEQPGEPSELPDTDIIVPVTYWREHQSQLKQRTDKIAVCINGDDDIDQLADELDRFDMIALEFPKFTDGRNYSNARLLRERYGYTGELRAVGDVLRDQLFFMKRCGINSFQVREGTDIEEALKGLSIFSVTYQAAADGSEPVSKYR